MNSKTAWIDRAHYPYEMKDIDDRYLLNIIKFIHGGGGHTYFLTEKKVRALFDEASRRGIIHSYSADTALKALNMKHTEEVFRDILEEEEF